MEPVLLSGAEPVRPPSYREKPQEGEASIHTPSEAGSPTHEPDPTAEGMEGMARNGLPITVTGLRPISQPPSYEDVLREDRHLHQHPHPGLIGHGVLGDDDHFEAQDSD